MIPTTVGLDLAKNVFHVHVADASPPHADRARDPVAPSAPRRSCGAACPSHRPQSRLSRPPETGSCALHQLDKPDLVQPVPATGTVGGVKNFDLWAVIEVGLIIGS